MIKSAWYRWRYRSRIGVASRVARLLPASVVYHALIRGWAHATVGKYGHEVAPGVLMTDVVERWAKDKGVTQ